MEFKEFPKISRFYEQNICITEKIDGTNGLIWIGDVEEASIQTGRISYKLGIKAGSRTKWVAPNDDNYGFAKWVEENEKELLKLGPGYHYGEWWGQGIQRKYSMPKKVFSLFNVHKWADETLRPVCCDVVPILYTGEINPEIVNRFRKPLAVSEAAKKYGIEFNKPEGVMMYFTKANTYFKAPTKKRGKL